MNSQISFDVILNSEVHSHKQLRLRIDAYILQSPIDVILGRQTIKKHNLVNEFPSHFYARPAHTNSLYLLPARKSRTVLRNLTKWPLDCTDRTVPPKCTDSTNLCTDSTTPIICTGITEPDGTDLTDPVANFGARGARVITASVCQR